MIKNSWISVFLKLKCKWSHAIGNFEKLVELTTIFKTNRRHPWCKVESWYLATENLMIMTHCRKCAFLWLRLHPQLIAKNRTHHFHSKLSHPITNCKFRHPTCLSWKTVTKGWRRNVERFVLYWQSFFVRHELSSVANRLSLRVLIIHWKKPLKFFSPNPMTQNLIQSSKNPHASMTFAPSVAWTFAISAQMLRTLFAV